ncbi:MAG TPA: YciI family protein [Ardenticatenaceae bacterium]|nr:YciI family protein [Ardenticatenaceae bacterium]
MDGQQIRQFLYRFEPVRPEMVDNPDLWTEDDVRLAEEHFAYLERATAAGTLLLAGRCLDGEGPAIVIVEARSEDEARRFMENDPFVSGGFARAYLHPFRAPLVRK